MMDRIFGGSPIPVLLRLLVLSFVVGLALWIFGIDPMDLWYHFGETVREVWENMGDFARWAIKYVALGAIVVLPLWIIFRILRVVTTPKKG
jgi:hypothetical protein